jgi:Swt1-like HEPN
VITRVLSAKHGKDWWKTCAPPKVQTRVADRRAKEADTPWHGKRGTDDIYYSDFSNLGDIITKNWTEFAPIFVKQSWITKLEELEAPRNIVAHNNPLSKQEETRVDLYFNDWIALLNERKDLVP